MKRKYSSFSALLTPILIVAILLFAGLVAFSSFSVIKREREYIESYTHSRMKSLILDLETKLVSAEAAMLAESHMHFTDLEDSVYIYKHLDDFVRDQKFINHVGLEIWYEDRPDTMSYTLYVTEEEGVIRHEFIETPDYQVPGDDMSCFLKAYDSKRPVWSHPYRDTLFVNTCVITGYTRAEDRWAMICADVEMNSLLEAIENLQFYKDSKMYIDVPGGDTYFLDESGHLVYVDELKIDERKFTKIVARYRRLDIDIINVVPHDMIYDSLFRNISIVSLVFILGIISLAFLVHKSFNRVQDNLARSIRKADEEKAALKRIEDEIAIAANIQKKMLTPPGEPVHFAPPEGRPVDIMSRLIPAREVGGDLYEYSLEGDNLLVCIGDVSGKGVPAALVMARCSTLFHAYASDVPDPDPAKMLSYLNRQLCRRNDEVMFVTMWAGVLDVRTGKLKYSSAGHNPPVYVSEGKSRFIDLCQGMPLGMFEDSKYDVVECNLNPGDSLLLYSDGVTEAEGPGHVLFGDERLLQACASVVSTCPEVICRAVLDSVANHASGCSQSDDITLLCFSCGSRFAQLRGVDDVKSIHTLVEECGQSFDAALVLEEAAVNAVRHGGANFVNVEFKDGKFIMFANGDDFDPTKYVVPEEGAELRIGGRGIPIIRQLCSETTYCRTENGINIQTFTLK